jgi:hypothetical protein
LLIVNLRPIGDRAFRELWVALDGWERTRRLATIQGRPVWASHGEWFICQADSERPIKDPLMDRTVERIEKFSADGRVRHMLAAGSYPVLHEARGEIYYYRDVDDQGEAPAGLFAVSVTRRLRPVYPCRAHKFWKEDGTLRAGAAVILHAGTNRIVWPQAMGSRCATAAGIRP